MSDYIERESIAEPLRRVIEHGIPDRNGGHILSAETVLQFLMEIKSKDVVPVVRCEDCIFHDGTVPGQPNILCYQMHEDDFCSYGERKE